MLGKTLYIRPYEEANIVPEDGGLSIKEVRGEFDHHREFGKLFQELASLQK